MSWNTAENKLERLFGQQVVPPTDEGNEKLKRLIKDSYNDYKARGNPNVPLILDVGQKVPWKFVVDVLDLGKDAGRAEARVRLRDRAGQVTPRGVRCRRRSRHSRGAASPRRSRRSRSAGSRRAPFFRTPMGPAVDPLRQRARSRRSGRCSERLNEAARPPPPAPKAGRVARRSRSPHPPRAFAPSPTCCTRSVTLEDYSRSPHDGAIGAALRFLQCSAGPGIAAGRRSTGPTSTSTQSLAHPEEFRGGLSGSAGSSAGIETRDIDHPALPEGGSSTGASYRPRGPRAIAPSYWETGRHRLETSTRYRPRGRGRFPSGHPVRGQGRRHPDGPFIVADSVTSPPVEPPRGVFSIGSLRPPSLFSSS